MPLTDKVKKAGWYAAKTAAGAVSLADLVTLPLRGPATDTSIIDAGFNRQQKRDEIIYNLRPYTQAEKKRCEAGEIERREKIAKAAAETSKTSGSLRVVTLSFIAAMEVATISEKAQLEAGVAAQDLKFSDIRPKGARKGMPPLP